MNSESVQDSVIYIPYQGPDNEDDQAQPEVYNPFKHRDLPNGYHLRLKSYRAAWAKCLDRVHAVIRDLHEPIVNAVVRYVHAAYTNVLPGLPYCEMPVISITAGASLLHEITIRLDPDNDLNADPESNSEASSHSATPEAYVTHLFPTERPNILACMKTLILGFVDRSPDGLIDQPKRKPSMSLAPYDIELLEAWFEVVRKAHEPAQPPQLVVLLHEFEQFDPAVIQDLFYICSLHIPHLPLVFIISLSFPPVPPSSSFMTSSVTPSASNPAPSSLAPTYLHLTYPRATLSLLHVQNFVVPSGVGVLDVILTKTMFDPEFETDIVIGPATIDFLSDFFTRHNPSLDALITILHLAHLKHFDDPLTVFTQDSLLGTNPHSQSTSTPADILHLPTSRPFLLHLLTRAHALSPPLAPSPQHASLWRTQDLPSLIATVDAARVAFRAQMRRTRMAFGLMRLIKAFMLKQGWKSAGGDRYVREVGDDMAQALRGRLGRDARYLGTMVKKLPAAKLRALLDEMHTWFHNMLGQFRREQEEIRTKIVEAIVTLKSESSETSQSGHVVQIAGEVGEWLTVYFQNNLMNVEECKFSDIWYTGSTPFPSEMINPSIRASIISGLLHPLDYIDADTASSSQQRKRPPAIWELPDTSILFKRYLESGKMINVYDWFESFAVVLESQKEHMKQARLADPVGGRGSTPRKGKGKSKGKQKQVEVDGDKEGEDEDDEEKWKMEMQARFIRSLHELDYLGFIKHTGRKADHVLRAVFDVAE